MYFVSGSIAAYLYYNAVEKREGRKFDIDGSPRHAKAKEAIEKWGERGWMFAEKDGRKKKSHAALEAGGRIKEGSLIFEEEWMFRV